MCLPQHDKISSPGSIIVVSVSDRIGLGYESPTRLCDKIQYCTLYPYPRIPETPVHVYSIATVIGGDRCFEFSREIVKGGLRMIDARLADSDKNVRHLLELRACSCDCHWGLSSHGLVHGLEIFFFWKIEHPSVTYGTK